MPKLIATTTTDAMAVRRKIRPRKRWTVFKKI
jgi:hypothetical protein